MYREVFVPVDNSECSDWAVQRAIEVCRRSEGRITGTLRDGFHFRRAAAEKRIPCFTSLDTARAAVDVLLSGEHAYTVQPLAAYLHEPQIGRSGR